MLMIHTANHWGVQRTTEELKQKFYWPNWRKEVSVFVSDCAGCLHREIIDLKVLNAAFGAFISSGTLSNTMYSLTSL